MYLRLFSFALFMVLAACQGNGTVPSTDAPSKKAGAKIAHEPKPIVQPKSIPKHLLTGQGLKDVLLGGSFSNTRGQSHGFTWNFKANGECILAGGDGAGRYMMQCQIKNDRFCTDKKISKSNLKLDLFGRVIDVDRFGNKIEEKMIMFNDCQRVFHVDGNLFSFENIYVEGSSTYEYESY
jgi:hypothetical protein